MFDIQLPKLSAGAHAEGDGSMCAMELVAFMERLPHSDKPECTCPVIAAYVRRINDRFNDADRQKLLKYLPRLVNTVSPEHEQARAEYIAMMAVNVFASKALEGRIDVTLIQAMRDAKTLISAKTAAAAAADTAADTAADAYADAYADAADAADADAYAAADAVAAAAYAAYAAADAADAADTADTAAAAAYAADTAADAADAAYAAYADDIWAGLEGMLAIVPKPKVFWTKERAEEALKVVA